MQEELVVNDDDELEYRRAVFLDGVVDTLDGVKNGEAMVFFFPIQEGRDRFMAHVTLADGTELELSLDVRRKAGNHG